MAMGADQNHDWQELAASALEWWHDAGVDTLVEEAPRDWLAQVAARPGDVPVEPKARELPDELPGELATFLAWRGGEAAPEAGWPGCRIAASGPATADLMILVDCPERDDRAALMEGAVGRLFDRMLAAIGHTRETIHLAAVCASRPTGGRVPRDSEARLAECALHHVALVAPNRLLVMGNAASRAILSMNVAEARGALRPINPKPGITIRVVASFHPRFLLERPAAKADAWRDLQMLMGTKA